MSDDEREWRLDVVNRRLKEQGYNSLARYVDKIAAGSPASYKGTPFKFEMRGGVPPPKVPLMPLNLERNQKWEGQERVITPRKQKLEQASSSPSIAGSAQEQAQAAILERLDQMEQAARKNTSEGLMASALNKQTEMMDKVFNKPVETRRGVIRIEPKVHWPILNNDDLEVEDF